MEITAVYARLTQVFRDVFDDDDIVLEPHFTAADVSGWDSLKHVRLILNAEKQFGVKISAAEAGRLKNVGDLATLLGAKVP